MADIEVSETGVQSGLGEVIAISDEERARERALRERFASFWGSASGDMRSTYDIFISATPVADGTTSEEIDAGDVRGWWVRPVKTREPGGASSSFTVEDMSSVRRRPIAASSARSSGERGYRHSHLTIRSRRKPACRRGRPLFWLHGTGWPRRASSASRSSGIRPAAV